MAGHTSTAEANSGAGRYQADLLALLSDEIGTALTEVIDLAGQLLKTPLDPDQRDRVEAIRSSGAALLGVVGDIVDVSRIDAGRVALDTVLFDPVAVTRGALATFADRARAAGTELRLDVRRHTPAAVTGDPGRFRQVLAILVDNAVKATPGGTVAVRLAPAKPLLRVEVRDTGVGIDTDTIERLLGDAGRADGDGAPEECGGLGLAVARRLVSLMGGEIGAQSRLGRGSTFWFTASLPEHDGGDGPSEDVAALARLRAVLVVEDDPMRQRTLAAHLGRLGFRPEMVGSGPAAVDAIGAGRYALILMDCEMQDMDGYETTAEMRRRGVHVPIVAMLPTTRSRDRDRCLAAGMDDLLPKPVGLSDLENALARWLPTGG